ncbi:unnamed protein product, partial [Ectocarpus sp. 12 AP-2014]
MASATFLEEVMGMGGFPRMKAMRCFSASLRCGRPPDAAGDRLAPGIFSARSSSSSSSSCSSRSSSSSKGGCRGKRKSARDPAPFSVDDGVVQLQGTRLDGAAAAATESPGGMRVEDLLAIAGDDPSGARLVDTKWRTCCDIPMVGPGGAGLAIIVAQPLSFETARRLRLQAEQERTRGSATCQAVVGVAKERHPDAHFLRDIPPETLDALIPVGTSRGQQKQSSAAAASADGASRSAAG